MTNRLYILCEGETEETFVRELLSPYFENFTIYVTPILLDTCLGHKGNYEKIKKQIIKLCHQDKTAFVTTFIDFYGFPENFSFPEKTTACTIEYIKTTQLKIQQDINCSNFIAFLTAHEFEGLLFSDISKFQLWLDDESILGKLKEIRDLFDTPEHINNDKKTSPSHRILNVMTDYDKVILGNSIALDIGLDIIMQECLHFKDWIETLKNFFSDRKIK
jgi:hypothetical protein